MTDGKPGFFFLSFLFFFLFSPIWKFHLDILLFATALTNSDRNEGKSKLMFISCNSAHMTVIYV